MGIKPQVKQRILAEYMATNLGRGRIAASMTQPILARIRYHMQHAPPLMIHTSMPQQTPAHDPTSVAVEFTLTRKRAKATLGKAFDEMHAEAVDRLVEAIYQHPQALFATFKVWSVHSSSRPYLWSRTFAAFKFTLEFWFEPGEVPLAA